MAQTSSRLSPGQVAGLLVATRVAVEAEIGALPEAALGWHPGPGEWCVKEALGHLIEAERRGFAGRVRQLLAAPAEPTLETWDQAAVAKARRDCQRPSSELLAEFAEQRRLSIQLVAAIGDVDQERRGRHPEVGTLSVRELLQEWVHHDRNHLRQVLANVQDYVWPAMGNAQRFSRPGTPDLHE